MYHPILSIKRFLIMEHNIQAQSILVKTNKADHRPTKQPFYNNKSPPLVVVKVLKLKKNKKYF